MHGSSNYELNTITKMRFTSKNEKQLSLYLECCVYCCRPVGHSSRVVSKKKSNLSGGSSAGHYRNLRCVKCFLCSALWQLAAAIRKELFRHC